MRRLWITADQLAAKLGVSVKSIRRAYRKGEIPVDRFCRFVRFDLERVKEALKAKGRELTFVLSKKEVGPRSRPAPDWVRRGRLSHGPQGGRNDRFWRIHPDH
jgi:excisionase family DNA binding protein